MEIILNGSHIALQPQSSLAISSGVFPNRFSKYLSKQGLHWMPLVVAIIILVVIGAPHLWQRCGVVIVGSPAQYTSTCGTLDRWLEFLPCEGAKYGYIGCSEI